MNYSLHPGAEQDIADALVFYAEQAAPLVAERFGLSDAAVLLGEFDLDALLSFVPDVVKIKKLPVTPPVLQELRHLRPLFLMGSSTRPS